jgi:hypothetical protein
MQKQAYPEKEYQRQEDEQVQQQTIKPTPASPA